MINVLIVEDDPMVAQLNRKYLEEIGGFYLMGISHSFEDAIMALADTNIDLILLDVYMPGKRTGLDLLTHIRKKQLDTDVILITAESEVENIQEALRMGVVDYLIKPFEFERFIRAVNTYKQSRKVLQKQSTIDQKELDILLMKNSEGNEEKIPLPKGLTMHTLSSVLEVLESFGDESFSTDEISEKTAISRVSIRKYLKFLKVIGVVDETLIYGIGRPLYKYKMNKSKRTKLERYL